MKYSYPYHLFLVGLLLFGGMCSFGFYTITQISPLPLLLMVLYVLACCLLAVWYVIWYQTYKNSYIIVTDLTLTIVKGESKTVLSSDQIFSIVEFNKEPYSRVLNQLHISNTLGQPICISDEIKSYNKLKDHLRNLFPEKYKTESSCLAETTKFIN